MNIIKTEIEGVFIIEPVVFGDHRGYFMETFRQDEFESKVLKTTFIQENENKSSYGVIRGLHFQKPPYSQSKLARVIDGAVLDVAVDIRKDSPTYGKYVAVELSADNHRQLFLPRGMAHGMVCLSPTCIFAYKVDNFYNPQSEGYLAWNDPEINIDWMVPCDKIILSDKDKNHPTLKTLETPFTMDNLYNNK